MGCRVPGEEGGSRLWANHDHGSILADESGTCKVKERETDVLEALLYTGRG